MNFNLTLAILKPDISQFPHILEAIQRSIISNGLSFVKTKRTHISKTQAEQFYQEHINRFFYNRLITFICSGPSEVFILGGTDSINRWRKLMGPTKTFQTHFTHPDSIRGQFGLTDTRNATHGSDSVTSALREIQIIFPEFNLFTWYEEMKTKEEEKHWDPHLLQSIYKLKKNK